MATDIADWKITASDNANVDGTSGTDVAENNLPRTVNDAIRAIQSGVAARHRVIRFFEDFVGGAIDGRISSTAGSGANTEALTIVANGQGGLATIKTSDADDTHAANGTAVSLDELNFLPSVGGMMLEVRLKVDDISAVAIFVGFSDVISSTVELPVYKTSGADTLDSDATNACGIGFDTDGTTDQWWHGGVAAGTDTAATHSGTAPVNDTFVILRVEVTAAGAVTGYVNDTAIGAAVASAITASTPVTPYIVVANRSAAQRVVTIDYILAQQSRT